MTTNRIQDKINSLKQSGVQLISNIVPGYSTDADRVFENDNAIVYCLRGEYCNRVFFSTTDIKSLNELLKRIEGNSVIHYIYKKDNPLKDCLSGSGFNHYAKYERVTTCYNQKPFDYPQDDLQVILGKKYDREFGDYADINDVEELFELNKDIFDKYCDDIYTVDEWYDLINNKQCMVFKAKGKIVTYFVWKPEGKKIFFNISVNLGPANWLYNIERRIFEYYWERGIRVFSGWWNVENEKAINREKAILDTESVEAVKNKLYLYDEIYVKN